MQSSLVIVVALLGTAAVALALAFGRMLAPRRGTGSLRRAANFRVERYRPLERLLAVSDFEFLRVQRGYDRGIERGLRQERVRLFRRYLRSLTGDFRALQAVARAVAAATPNGSVLIPALLRQALLFHTAWVMVQFRLVLYEWDLARVTFPVADLVRATAEMHRQVVSLSATPQVTPQAA